MSLSGPAELCQFICPPLVTLSDTWQHPWSHLVTFANRLFSLFDELADRLGVQKVETAGDCYIVAAGILTLDAEGYSEV